MSFMVKLVRPVFFPRTVAFGGTEFSDPLEKGGNRAQRLVHSCACALDITQTSTILNSCLDLKSCPDRIVCASNSVRSPQHLAVIDMKAQNMCIQLQVP